MENITEILKFLEKSGTDSTIQEIRIYANSLINKHGADADLFFSDNIARIKTFYDLMETFYKLKLPALIENDYQKSNVTHRIMNQTDSTGKSATTKIYSRSNSNQHSQNGFDIEETTNQRESGDIDFAAEILPYKKTYIRELCRKNRIPYSKPGGKFIFNRTDLEKWLRQNGADQRKELLKIGSQVKLPSRKN